ncbi:hypothetical protein AB832_00225 [Flavobacteriaceae bacterium (ex Bugula neritina AB1)]|nr:hypothetical protein AB832_00225 [Flavobacteriaceae bacterium (ex Bugula neritina AB1)]
MKTHILSYKILLGIVSFLFISCEQDIENPQDEVVKVENGTLFFKDQDSFKNQIEALHLMSGSERESWLREIKFSNSLYQKTKDLTIEEILDQNYVEVADRVFSVILNSDGVYVVGNTAHKILQYEELTLDKSDFVNNKNSWNKKNVVKRYPIYYSDGDYLKKLTAKSPVDVLYKTEPYNGDFVYPNNILQRANLGVRHLSAHLLGWNRGYVGYASVGIKITGRKKKRGKWRNDDMWYASITYDAEVVGDFGTIREKSGFKSGTNEKDVQETIFWKTGGRYSQGHIDADFEYEDDGYLRVRSDVSGYGFRF